MIDLPTPSLLIDAAKVRQNIERMAKYAAKHGIKLRPHTKTHKSLRIAAMQMEAGAVGLTVAKAGEAAVMAEAADDILMAYPTADARRCEAVAELALRKTVRVGLDSEEAAERLSAAAASAGSRVGVLVDLDVGVHRTGVQSVAAALELGQRVARLPGVRLDGLMIYPGHIWLKPAEQGAALGAVNALAEEAIGLFKRSGLATTIVSGGSTPTAYQSHLAKHQTEIRPGTYVFNDMNCVRGGFVMLEECALRVLCTVVSTAVPGQMVIDAGTKTLTSDRCGPAPDSGHGYVVEYPEAKITKLTEEHGQVDISACERRPKVGEQVMVIPNHVCPCVNLQDRVYWCEGEEAAVGIEVDARGRVF